MNSTSLASLQQWLDQLNDHIPSLPKLGRFNILKILEVFGIFDELNFKNHQKAISFYIKQKQNNTPRPISVVLEPSTVREGNDSIIKSIGQRRKNAELDLIWNCSESFESFVSTARNEKNSFGICYYKS